MDPQKRDSVTQCIFLFDPNGSEVTDVHYVLNGDRMHKRLSGWIPPGVAMIKLGHARSLRVTQKVGVPASLAPSLEQDE